MFGYAITESDRFCSVYGTAHCLMRTRWARAGLHAACASGARASLTASLPTLLSLSTAQRNVHSDDTVGSSGPIQQF